MNTTEALSALATLAQQLRLASSAIWSLSGRRASRPPKIGQELKMPASSLSFHLKELNHAGLIMSRQDGRFIIYAANFDHMNSLVAFLSENCCGGNLCSPKLQSCGIELPIA